MQTTARTPFTKASPPRRHPMATPIFTPPTSGPGGEAYDSNFKPVVLPGGLFVDPRLPQATHPSTFRNSRAAVRDYAKQDATLHDDVAGPGHGFVDVFTNDGAFIKRLVTRGQLNSPWGWGWPRWFRAVRWRPAGRELR